MTFEFVIACHGKYDHDTDLILTELLSEALEANQYDFDDYTLSEMVRVNQVRESHEESQETEGIGYTLVGFNVELDDVDVTEAVIGDFAGSLVGFWTIYHAIRLEDPLLQRELADIGAVIFELEMKLRRVLSFIYLHAYPSEPYNLLRRDRSKTMPANMPEGQMQEVIENQFFHMTFSDYIRLNERRSFSQKELQDALSDSDIYDRLRAEMAHLPIEHENDVELLNDLKRLMKPIEDMRNCVAHNRRPEDEVRGHYFRSVPLLEERLDRYLTDIAINQP